MSDQALVSFPGHEEISVEALVRCAQRELGYRKRVYSRRVAEEKMSATVAEHEIACMKRILEILQGMEDQLL